MTRLPDFDTPPLARAAEALESEQTDMLPFGVIGLDADGVVHVFNKAEATLSGYGDRPSMGQVFFVDVAPCMNNGDFKGVQSAADGGGWIFLNRVSGAAA